jgi:hypothetical protein
MLTSKGLQRNNLSEKLLYSVRKSDLFPKEFERKTRRSITKSFLNIIYQFCRSDKNAILAAFCIIFHILAQRGFSCTHAQFRPETTKEN